MLRKSWYMWVWVCKWFGQEISAFHWWIVSIWFFLVGSNAGQYFRELFGNDVSYRWRSIFICSWARNPARHFWANFCGITFEAGEGAQVLGGEWFFALNWISWCRICAEWLKLIVFWVQFLKWSRILTKWKFSLAIRNRLHHDFSNANIDPDVFGWRSTPQHQEGLLNFQKFEVDLVYRHFRYFCHMVKIK